MRKHGRKASWARQPQNSRSLGGDIVALLRRALREEEYAAAEHLLLALEELEQRASDKPPRACYSQEVDAAYLEIARSLGAKPRLGHGESPVQKRDA